MSTQMIVGIVAAVVAILSGGVLFYYLFLIPRQQGNVRALMGKPTRMGAGEFKRSERDSESFDTGVELPRKAKPKKEVLTLEEKFFRAGIFSPEEKKAFQRSRIITPLVIAPVLTFLLGKAGEELGLIGLILGLLVGFQLPFTRLDWRMKARADEILYYLPLVIEQIAIGVSSSLDIGPCLQQVVQMADERDTHNPVTELVRYAQYHIKSGVSLEDALQEVGIRSGHTELKHAFMSLSQVAKHGGEISRQLQELADAVASQRETQIEGQIKKLELQATGPVGCVFLGFMLIILIGFGLQLKGVFG